MKKIILLLIVAVTVSNTLTAQDTKLDADKQYMQITTVESVLAGGIGRSKMIITNPDGSQKESDLERRQAAENAEGIYWHWLEA